MIVGAGYIGLETAEALRMRGLAVTVVEQLPNVLPTVDRELGALVLEELERNRVVVANGVTVTAIEADGRQLAVLGEPGFRIEADLVLVVVGVRPDSALAGLRAHNPRGGLQQGSPTLAVRAFAGVCVTSGRPRAGSARCARGLCGRGFAAFAGCSCGAVAARDLHTKERPACPA